jgi:hypothetical protein
MKYLLSILLVLSSLTLTAQDVTGEYQVKSNSDDFSLLRTLTLNADGTFAFYNFRYIEKGIPKETYTYAKGKWTQDKNIITFSTEAADIDEKHTLDFNNSKALFHSKSHRDTSDRIVKTFIQFYDTKVKIMKGLRMFKN